MKFKGDFLYNYLRNAPVPLALERTLECEILSQQKFVKPVLDVGCGEGLFSHILFDEKIAVGIDPDENELKRCEQYEMYDELIQCYGDDIPKESKSFNTILSNSTLEHIPNLEAVLNETHRLLADDGKMYITIPTDYFDKYNIVYQILSIIGLKTLAAKYTVFFNGFWKHYHYYDAGGWEELFQKTGFTVINMREYDSKAMCITNDLLAPLSLFQFVWKKLTNRWIIFPPLRIITAAFLNMLLKTVIQKDLKTTSKAGLIFFELGKAKRG